MDKVYFNTGDLVKVVGRGFNASDFTLKNPIPSTGVYHFNDWEDKEFVIGGVYEPMKFKYNPNIYGAYPLLFDNKLVGYVYNVGLKLV